MVEDKDIDIQYTRSENNPAYIMTNNTSEKYFTMHIKRITEGELREFVYTGRENVKKNRVTDDFITCDKNEYSSHALAEVLGEKNRN